MTSPLSLAIIGFMVTMIFLNLVVFGTDPLLGILLENKDEIQEMNCNKLHHHINEGHRGWDYASVLYDMKCKYYEPPKLVTTDKGEFYRYDEGGIMSSKHYYDGFYELIPTEIDDICTFKVTNHYHWCADELGEEELFVNESLKVCNDGYYQAMRLNDGACVAIFNFGWVDDYNRAVQETEFEITPLYKVKEWQK